MTESLAIGERPSWPVFPDASLRRNADGCGGDECRPVLAHMGQARFVYFGRSIPSVLLRP